METIVVPTLLISLIWKVIDTAKFATNKDWKTFVTQIIIFIVGILGVFLFAEADAFNSYVVPGLERALGDLDAWGKIILGLALTSTGSVAFDFKKAFDRSDSAKTPALIPGPGVGTPPPPPPA